LSGAGKSGNFQGMPLTLFDKIWNSHLVTRRADGRDLIYIDRHVLHELHAPHAFEQIEKQHRPVRRPDLTFSVQDHTIATRPGRTDATNPDGAAFLRAMREGSRKNGIRIFDIGDPEQGISHVVAPELGMVLPGATHAVPDSHAATVGGLGALAFGCGTSELAHILATQVMALRRPQTMRIRLEGSLGPHVSAKDVALRIIAELGVAGARGFAVEYAGAAVRAMPIEQRMTLCNLNIEMGGRSGFVAPDERTFAWIEGRPWAPKGAQWTTALAYWCTPRATRMRSSIASTCSIARVLSRRSRGAPIRAKCLAFPAASPIRPPPTQAAAPPWNGRSPTWICGPACRLPDCR
jgi:3-isopropylmalate/(R)-2-methylmalate dehydratase large subunit